MSFGLVSALALAFLLANLPGCDASVDAFDDEIGPYSIVGYLDPVADTQFVRVEALQDSVLVGGPLPDARVTTTDLESGAAVAWQDTLIEVGTDVFAPLFYTTAPLRPEARYRFEAERRSDGAVSEATVATPKRIPPLELVSSAVPAVPPAPPSPPGLTGGPDEVVVIVRNTDTVGGVRADYIYQYCFPTPKGIECQRFSNTFFHLGRAQCVAEGRYRVDIPWRADIESTLAGEEYFAGFYSFRITVASVSETWPDYGMPIDSVLARQPPLSAEVSNVEDGTGFLGGAAIRTVEVPLTQGPGGSP